MIKYITITKSIFESIFLSVISIFFILIQIILQVARIAHVAQRTHVVLLASGLQAVLTDRRLRAPRRTPDSMVPLAHNLGSNTLCVLTANRRWTTMALPLDAAPANGLAASERAYTPAPTISAVQ